MRFATRQEEVEIAVLHNLGVPGLGAPDITHQLAMEYRLMPAPGAVKCLWEMTKRRD